MLLGVHGEIKVADFGVAKARSRSYHTVSGSIKGKAPYMAPEQILGEPLDRRADVFSLGVLLFELDDAHAAVLGARRTRAMKQILDGAVPDPAERRPGYPPELTAIVRRALARDPGERYPTARAFVDELDRVARERRWNLSRAASPSRRAGRRASSSRPRRRCAQRCARREARAMTAAGAEDRESRRAVPGDRRRSAPAARRASISRGSTARTASSATS